MILTDSEVTPLKSLLHWWEWFGYASTAVVGLGCVGEFVAEFTSVSKDKNRKHKLARLSLIVLILGIAGELLSAGRTSNLSGQLIANIEERAGNAERKAGEANDRASVNEKDAAQLRKDAEQLHKEAEAEHLARVKIEAAVAWRSLNDTQKREIGTALVSFSPRAGASIWFNGSSTEAEMFADDIAEALRFGHITTSAPAGMLEMRGGGKWDEPIKPANTGVVIQSTKVPAAREFAEAVIKELNGRGFDAKRQTDPPFEDKPEPIIWINVEPRPKGPQGEYKLQIEREAKTKNTARKSR